MTPVSVAPLSAQPLPLHVITRREPPTSPSLLLVEDEQETITAIRAALASMLHVLEVAPVGQLTSGWVHDRAFDAILVSFSTADGIRAVTELKRIVDIPIVALVGGRDYFQTNYQLRMATLLGAAVMVSKPITGERLRVAVEQALRAHCL